MKSIFTFIGFMFLMVGFVFADQYTEAATDGTLDLEWDYNTTTHAAGDTILVVDSTGSAWGSHVLAYTDAGYTGLTHVKDVMLKNYTIEADMYIIGPAAPEAPLYAGVAIKMAHDATSYYRFIYRNSSSSDNGILKLQGYDGASWHISKTWYPGTDFTALETGWHNFKIMVKGADFYAYIDGELLPGCPYVDDSPFLTEGYPGIYKYNTGSATILFDNFMVTTADLFFSEYAEGSSSNKYVEIYNGTGAEVDLSTYSVQGTNNGTAWGDGGERDLSLTGMLADGDVYILAADQADPAILALADTALAYESPMHHNGDDGIALLKDGVIIDQIGVELDDPGTAWDVAGVTNATQNHTLVRKDDVNNGSTDWVAASGTSTEDSEWIVYPEDTWSYLGLHPGMAQGPVTVTFRANASRIFGLVDTSGTVDVRGSLQGWTPNANPLMSDGGDYWSLDWEFAAEEVGTTVEFKYGGNILNIDGTYFNGWENDLPGANYQGGNRNFVVPTVDTVLPIDYVGHTDGAPFVDDPDSLDVFFRVNMSTNAAFNPETQNVHIAGSLEGWSHTIILDREGESDYFSGQYKVGHKDSTVAIEWKYTLGDWSGTHESIDNRTATIHQDTTLQFVYYNDVLPVAAAGEDTVDVMFTADFNRAILENGFTVGDTVIVEWGYEGTAVLAADTLIQQLVPANYYAKTVSAERVALGTTLEYRYYKISRGERFEEIYYDFDTQQNNRILTLPAMVGDGEVLDAMDNVESNTDPHRQPRFRNTDLMSQDVLVTFEVDMRPAYYQLFLNDGAILDDIQGDIDVVEADSVQAWGVAMNGPATIGGWGNPTGDGDWGMHLMTLDEKRMWDDGTNGGDMTAGDTIWTRQRQFYSDPDSNHVIGQEFKFGIRGGDNEGGDGGYGLNHIENIEDANPTMTIHSQFGSINPIFYSSWDFDLGEINGLADEGAIVRTSRLVGNYPNPFNPVTTIRFELAKVQEVKLVVYDVIGREVTRLLNGPQQAGVHKVLWNGRDTRGNTVSTGVYFYRLTAGKYSKTMKMILMK